jgi:hypothetical protein
MYTGSYLTFNSGHVGWLAWSSDTIVKADPLKMIQANVGLNWPGIFREEDLKIKTQSIIFMYTCITLFHERQSSPRVIKTTIQGTKARDNYI